MYKKQANKNTGEPKVIELNLSATVAVIIAIIVLIVTVTSVKVITTIIEAEESRKLNNEEQNANERVTYVNSTIKDESGNIVNETDTNGNVIQVPVPKGYSASKIEGETTASKGFVIYEGDVDWSTILVDIGSTQSNAAIDEPAFDDDMTVINENMLESDTVQDANDDENTADDATTNDDTTTDPTTPTQEEINIFNLQKTRNQYVWVPVDDPARIYGVDNKGKIWGKLYDFSNTGRKALNWTETNGIMNITNKIGYREPDVFKGTTDWYFSRYNLGVVETKYEMLTKELEQNYYKMIESIKKYGGFYIGRYETGGLNGTAVVRKMDIDISRNDWKKNYKKCLTLRGKNTYVKTLMIFGNLWDETLEWLVKSGATISDGTVLTYQLIKNTEAFGNYYDTTFKYIAGNANVPVLTEVKEPKVTTMIPTGSAEYSKINNIYDLAGNVWDVTIEAHSTGSRVFRGGSYNYDVPVFNRSDVVPGGDIPAHGCRSVLWIK